MYNKSYAPHFDALYSVSDLHLGGRSGFQIFNQGPRLAATIDRIREQDADLDIALVLNGDIVDFLAEADDQQRTYLETSRIIEVLDRIRKDDAFSMVWDALARFVRTPLRHLVIVLGNHDVELALPAGRQWLIETLAGSDDAARGRLSLHLDGVGFEANVGGRRVLCTHGNDTDPWNVVDFRQLLGVHRDLVYGKKPEPWTPNAGTRLVIDVMNGVKRQFPMVDLLKPETRAVLPLLAALVPIQLRNIADILRTVAQRSFDGFRLRAGFLGEDPSPPREEALSDDEIMQEILRALPDSPNSPSVAGQRGALDPFALQRELEQGVTSTSTPTPNADGTVPELLGIRSGLARIFGQESRNDVLRRALALLLANDPSFDTSYPDEQYQSLDKEIDAKVDFVVAGHTHLRRSIARNGSGHYLNTGTWIRLIRVPPSVLSDDDAFDAFMRIIASPTLQALDRATFDDQSPYVLIEPTVAEIRRRPDQNGVSARLLEADAKGQLTPVKKSSEALLSTLG